MKFKLPIWIISLPVIAICALFQLTFDWGEQGRLDSNFLREKIYPTARMVNGLMTNIKFKLRGETKPKNKVVILAADEASLGVLGRWPWHREIYGDIVDSVFKLGAKQLALDIMFAEPEERVPQKLYELLGATHPEMVSKVKELEGDPYFAEKIKLYKEKLVLGYAVNAFCQPRYSESAEDCPVKDKDFTAQLEGELGKFGYPVSSPVDENLLTSTPLMYLFTAVSNIPSYREAADHSGAIFIIPDPDGYVRRYPLVTFHRNRFYPSLALEMASIAKGAPPKISLTSDLRISRIEFEKENKNVPVTPLGYIDINFRGGNGVNRAFEYVSAVDALKAADPSIPSTPEIEKARIALKDSYVFFGATALGIYDMRAFPFDSNSPGVEGHATAFDNLMENDALKSATSIGYQWLPLALLVLFGILFAIAFAHFEAIPSLAIFAAFCLIAGTIDAKILFARNLNLPTAFLLSETLIIFALILSLRYILEERNRKQIKSAFSHYLAPAVVDMVLKDPSKLTVGGERKDITILFSDLRGFTTLSENMDPKTLSQFLNEYLTEMTEIVFEYGGTLDKYIGDAVMAFWGAPVHSPEHSYLASLAGLRMQQRLLEIAPDFKARYNLKAEMGIGINSGVVSVGNMGSKRIFEYTVIGDHVNLASRLEGLTKMYGVKIITTRNTLDMIPAGVEKKVYHRVIDSVKVKGKKNATDLLEISMEAFPEEAMKHFNLARELFQKREWSASKQNFTLANGLFEKAWNRPDSVCVLFIERCDEFEQSPPPEDWDGSVEMKTK